MGVLERRGRGLRFLLLPLVAITLVACAGAGAPQILSTVGAPIPDDVGGAAATAAPAGDLFGREGSQAGGQLPGGDDDAPSAPRDDLRIVYTGALQLVVDDLQPALARAKAAVLAVGGYVGASEESNDGDQSVATITYRIPAERWEDAIADLRGLAIKVVAEQTQATEVGGQVVDLEARLRNLRASEASLQEIAKGAGRISDLLEVEAQLTQVRGQIEQLDGQLARLEDQVAYGTLITTFGLEVVAVQEQAEGWDPASDVDGATATLIGVGQALVSAGIWFGIVWLPAILLLVLVALLGRWLFHRLVPAGPGRPDRPIAGWGGEA
jgi:Domain of unknown function (DUF4349)